MLFWCDYARAIWFSSACSYKPNSMGFPSFARWWIAVDQEFHADYDSLNLIALVCWHSWKERNRVVFHHVQPNPCYVTRQISKCFDEIFQTTTPISSMVPRSSVSNSPANWTPPSTGFIKFNFNASWKEGSSIAAIVVIARNSKGDLIDGYAKKVIIASPLSGEANAFLQAIILAMATGVKSIILETDSLIIFSAFQGKQDGNY
ncbi:hypothetical protein P3X46_013878 [Hevea brasiliensis]|uniref:RNase H type-1 domain-containing protein n=1 Tax=Hevea brasiliensis TaxID=3981 RepID=A0ABQ9M8S0_HEVBR|nr:hypothetical protein P3X46_013878 [Hevea brasiliensis]